VHIRFSGEVDLVSSFSGKGDPINTLTVSIFVERGATRVMWFFDGVLSRDFHQLVRKELTVYQWKRARTNVNKKNILICGFNSRMSETVCLRNKKYDMVVINAQLDNFSFAPSSAP